DETSPILKTFFTGLENQLSLKVKVIRSDNGTEFKNNDLNQFCGIKGIKREFSVPRTPQQNGITERKNKTLIEATRTMLADLLLPIPFWAEAVNTACYVQNRVLVTKPQNKTPYELLHGLTPSISFMRPLAILSAQSKKHDDKTKREAKGKSPVESLTRYKNLSAEFKDLSDNSIIEDNVVGTLVPAIGQLSPNNTNTFSAAGPSNAAASLTHGKSSCIDTSQLPDDPNMPELEDITYSDDEDDVGADADFKNLETSITVSPISTTRVHKDHLVTQIIGDLSLATQTRSMTRVAKDQGHTQEEGIHYEEVFAPVARIEAIRLFLAYASFMGFMVYQMDVKSAFLYGTIEEKVYVCQPPGFKDLDYHDKFYKVVKAFMDYIKLLELDGKSASTLKDTEKPLMKDPDGEDVDVHTYRSMIGSLMYLTSSRPEIMFAVYCKKQIVVATSSTEAEYVAAASYCAQVLWIQNQLLDYGPDQTVSSKDSSNPLMANNLPKIRWYSTHHVALMKSWLVQKQMALGVNTPRCDEDRLELMELMVFLLPSDEKVKVKVDAIDLLVSAVRLILLLLVQKFLLFGLTNLCYSLNAVSSIQYALTVNPNIYVSCIKQFWKSVAMKKVNDVMRLQALVDKKKIIITEASIRDALSQWKFMIHTILQCMSAKRTSWNEFSSSMESAADEGDAEVNVDDVPAVGVAAEGDVSAADDVVSIAVEEPSIPSPTPPTLLPQLLQDQPSTSQDAGLPMDLLQNLMYTCTTLTKRVKNLKHDKIAQAIEITKLKSRVKKLKRRNTTSKLQRLKKVGTTQRIETSDDTVMDDVSKQGRMIADMDADVDVTLKDVAADVKDVDAQDAKIDEKPAELQEVVEVVTTAKLITEVVTAASTTITAAAPQLNTAAASTLTTAARRRKGVVIRDPEESTTPSTIVHTEAKSKDKGDLDNLTSNVPIPLDSWTSRLLVYKLPLSEVVVEKSDAKIERSIKVQGRKIESQAQIYQIDLEHANKVLSMQDDEGEPTKLQKVVKVVTTAKLITEVVTAASATLTAATLQLTTVAALSDNKRRKGVVIRDPQETTTPSIIIYSEAKSKDKGKWILVKVPKPLKKQAQIEQDEKYARELEAELNKNINWDEVINHVKRKQKEDNAVKRYQALKRKPQTKAQARKNMMIYLRNVAGFKIDYFKGMTYDDIHKAAKKQKLDEEVEELKRHLQIVPNNEDDVYTEATPLARKVSVVGYEIYNENNKPYYKVKRVDGSHQLYLSFLSLLRNFDREDLEALWRLVKERFATTKPKNFSDDFLLITLGAMFGKPDLQAQIWKNQRSVYGQAKVKSWKLLESCGVQIITFTTTQLILLVERKYPLTSFGVDAAMDFKENMLSI
nr:ribonuclease H-like domain-containing protein [Tanacetum cinerariifolium]